MFSSRRNSKKLRSSIVAQRFLGWKAATVSAVWITLFSVLTEFDFAPNCHAQQTAALTQNETEPLRPFRLTVPSMGVRFRVVFYCRDAKIADQAAELIKSTLGEIQNTFTDYDAKSEAMRLSHLPAGARFPASAMMQDLLIKSQSVNDKTDGYFDITIGQLTGLWRKQKKEDDPHKQAKIQQQFQSVAAKIVARQGHACFHLDPQKSTFLQGSFEYKMDFGGIAKGYAADCLVQKLADELSIKHVLIDASGDITATEQPPSETNDSNNIGWLVGLSQIDPKEGLQHRIRLSNYSVASSGDARQFLEHNGVRTSHLLNPVTGSTIAGDHLTIVANPKGYVADALASALSVCPEDKFQQIIDRFPGTHAIRFQRRDSEIVETKSTQWERWISEHQTDRSP